MASEIYTAQKMCGQRTYSKDLGGNTGVFFFNQVPRFRAYSIGATRSKWRRKVVSLQRLPAEYALQPGLLSNGDALLSYPYVYYTIFSCQRGRWFIFFFFLIFRLDTGDGGVVSCAPFERKGDTQCQQERQMECEEDSASTSTSTE